MKTRISLGLVIGLLFFNISAQNSVAREWNEALLFAIRNDFARPTVHARNLFHSSVAMYDTWALFDDTAETVFLGKSYGGFNFIFDGIAPPTDVDQARHEMMSYLMLRLISHRFESSPNNEDIKDYLAELFTQFGYDINFVSTDYSTGSFAALGNYFAEQIIAFGLQDGSNEANDYANQYYQPVNQPIDLSQYEDNTLANPNRWQPLTFEVFIDQSGNDVEEVTPEFLSAEWGEVLPFALNSSDLQIMNNGFDSYIYNDPGPPPYIQNSSANGIEDPYKWNFALVIAWSAHLDPSDNFLIDISPGALGNVQLSEFPETFAEYKLFYNFLNGGDIGTGHPINPHTNLPYAPNMVKRGDYSRVLAEFWADGPDSETPPGHWFTILNYVSDHPNTVKQLNGSGPLLNDLEWDVKSYLVLGGAMHDSAIATWGIKGYYDFIRPISAIRYMAQKGQSTDASLASFDPQGLPLVSGLIELIQSGDPLAGTNGENIGKIKVKSWKGPDYIADPETDIAGVDWILGTHWWPYQRPSFVTPPFAGYLSGHSTFSRAAAEALSLITGDNYFPGGIGTFAVTENEFLVFEEGPTQDFVLQWATYQDASDQTSLSRIWGGIHPPIDDIKGRIIGDKVGKDAFAMAEDYFTGNALNLSNTPRPHKTITYPNPFKSQIHLKTSYTETLTIQIRDVLGKVLYENTCSQTNDVITIPAGAFPQGIYFVTGLSLGNKVLFQNKIIK